MFLKEKKTQDLIRIIDLAQLASPLDVTVEGRRQAGEEEQDPSGFDKQSLIFPSGESLPECWTNAEYQMQEAKRGAR